MILKKKKTGIFLKSRDDIKRIRESGVIISEAFREVSLMNLDGMKTWEVDSFIEDYIQKRKSRPAFKTVPGYNFATCISINNEVLHGIPSKKRFIKNGDIVKIDMGVVKNGFFADSCRTFMVGEVSSEAKKLVDASYSALYEAISIVTEGVRTGDIGSRIQMFAAGKGYTVVREFTGHGIGYLLHEPPNVPNYGKNGTGELLEEGAVIAIEPMLNQKGHRVKTLSDGWTTVTADGGLSAQFEHTVAVTKNGAEILTE